MYYVLEGSFTLLLVSATRGKDSCSSVALAREPNANSHIGIRMKPSSVQVVLTIGANASPDTPLGCGLRSGHVGRDCIHP